jgi:hypothetical protein
VSGGAGYDRDESLAERLDRNWTDLLQELRVCQTGVQLIAAFLLTLPFTDKFGDLDAFSERLYLGLVLLAALTTGLTLAPISIHRRLFGRRVKQRLVMAAHRLVFVVLAAIALLITGIAVLVFAVVVSRTAGLVVGAALVVVLTGLLVALPAQVARNAPPVRSDDRE